MLDYNTLNNLVEVFKKNGIKNIELENGSTIEVKEGTLLVNGEGVGVTYTAGTGIVISDENAIGVDTDIVALKSDIPTEKHLYRYNIELGGDTRGTITIISSVDKTPTSSEQLYHFLRELVPSVTGSIKNVGSVSCVCRVQGTDPNYRIIPLTSLYLSTSECRLIGHDYPAYSASPVEKNINITGYVYNSSWFLTKQEI